MSGARAKDDLEQRARLDNGPATNPSVLLAEAVREERDRKLSLMPWVIVGASNSSETTTGEIASLG